MTLPKVKFDELLDFAKRCQRFSLICQERVNYLEMYKVETDGILKAQEEQVYNLKEDLKAEKNKNKFIIPGLSLLAGFALGFFIAR